MESNRFKRFGKIFRDSDRFRETERFKKFQKKIEFVQNEVQNDLERFGKIVMLIALKGFKKV